MVCINNEVRLSLCLLVPNNNDGANDDDFNDDGANDDGPKDKSPNDDGPNDGLNDRRLRDNLFIEQKQKQKL